MLDRLCPDGYAVMSETGKQQRNKQKGEKDTFTIQRGCGWCHTGHTRHSFLVSYDSTRTGLTHPWQTYESTAAQNSLVSGRSSGLAKWRWRSELMFAQRFQLWWHHHGWQQEVNFRWACCSQQAVTGSHRRGNTRASWWKDDWRASLVSSLHVLNKHSSSKFPKHTKNSG